MPERYLRYAGKKPSLFQAMDEMKEDKTLLEAMRLELEPRRVDNGKASYWRFEDNFQEKSIHAAFASRREKKKKLDVIKLPLSLFNEAGIEPEADVDYRTFNCVSRLHYLVNLESEDARTRLAEAIIDAYRSQRLSKDDLYERIKRSSILPLIEEVYAECGDSLDLGKASPWAKAHILPDYDETET